MKLISLLLFILIAHLEACSQAPFKQDSLKNAFTKADTLRGKLTPLRACYDVTFYNLSVKIDIANKTLSGSNTFYIKVVEPFKTCQIDLFANMQIDKILYHNKPIRYKREYNAVYLYFPMELQVGSIDSFQVVYKGRPREAVRAPWDGGFVWRKDNDGNPWVGVACEGIGASLWWPLKDHLSDEPDSQAISIEIPDKKLTAVSNGRLRSVDELPNSRRFNWFVRYPINSYNVTLNIGNYVHFSDTYNSLDGRLTLDYYVLAYNEQKAKKHFQQVKNMLQCFEKYFGPYPFIMDGYKLVETDYWGMEHQSCVAYGNNYQNNEWGFDYIIVHESGHEWFGNSISVQDHAEMWIHEAFTTYTEAVFVEFTQGYDKMIQYLLSQKFNILNKEPIIGPLDVNYDQWLGGDMYFKGTWFLHTLRNIVNDDKLWFETIKSFALSFKYRTINTQQVINFFNTHLKQDLTHVFEQYLRFTQPPIFVYSIKPQNEGFELTYFWKTNVKPFKMPVEILVNGSAQRIVPTHEPQVLMLPSDQISVNKTKFYVFVEKAKN